MFIYIVVYIYNIPILIYKYHTSLEFLFFQAWLLMVVVISCFFSSLSLASKAILKHITSHRPIIGKVE